MSFELFSLSKKQILYKEFQKTRHLFINIVFFNVFFNSIILFSTNDLDNHLKSIIILCIFF